MSPDIGRRWYGFLILAASSGIVSALKNQPSGSTCGGCGFQFSRLTALASKIAQIGPPPLSFSVSP